MFHYLNRPYQCFLFHCISVTHGRLTWLLALPRSMRSRIYKTVRCLSVCLSVCPSTAANPLLQVRCCGPDEQETSIDCCSSGVQRANAGSVTFSAYVNCWTQTYYKNELVIYRSETDEPGENVVFKMIDELTKKQMHKVRPGVFGLYTVIASYPSLDVIQLPSGPCVLLLFILNDSCQSNYIKFLGLAELRRR